MNGRARARTRLNSYYVPNGIKDAPRFEKALQEIADCLKESGGFVGDNMVVWGRSMSFALDQKFMGAFNKAAPDERECGIIWRTHVLYGAALNGLRLEGDFVEAACYKGFSARVIADAADFSKSQKTYWLYDRFDVPSDLKLRLTEHSDALFDTVKARFSDLPNVRVIKGEIPQAFALGLPEKVAFLHIDMNNAAAEIATLDALWDRLVPGAFVVLDDYGWHVYRDQKDAEDDWFAKRGRMIIELPTGQGLVIR